MYMLTITPRDFAGAISDRYRGATTVRPLAPRLPQILVKSIRPSMPDEKICIRIPEAQVRTNNGQHRGRPSRSIKVRAIRDPKAAPRTPNNDILA